MADVARLVVYFEGDTSDLDKAYDRARRQRDDFIKQSSRSDDVKLTGDTSDLDKTYSQARRSQEKFIRDANKTSTVKLDVDDGGLQGTLSRASRSLSSFGRDTKSVETDTDGLSNAFVKLGGSSDESSGSLKGLADAMRSVKTVFVATTAVPGMIAAIGAVPAVAGAAAGAVGQLAIALGQGLAGGAAIGGVAIYGAIGSLKAYTAAITSTVTASREAYLATHEKVEAQLEERRQTILNTQASTAFNQQIDQTSIAMAKWQALIGRAAFPVFTRELRAWTNLMPVYNDYLEQTVSELARVAGGFSKWVRTARDGDMLQRTLQFINGSAQRAAYTLDYLGRSGFRVFQVLIAPAERLQEHIVRLAGSLEVWTRQSDNMEKVADVVQLLERRFYQLVTIVKNFGSGLIGVFQALNATGGPERLMKGLVGLSQSFDKLMEKGNGARAAIGRFMGYSQPALNQTWKLAKEVVIQFGLLANNVAKAGQAGGRMGTLAEVIRGLRQSVGPLRIMFQQTFVDLGPILARLIPQVVKFLTVFLSSTGPLAAFLRMTTGLLRAFNALPGPVKSLISNLVALQAIMRGLGITSLIGGLLRARAQMSALALTTGGTVPKMKALAMSMLGVQTASSGVAAGTSASGAAAAAAGSRWARLGGAVKGVGTALLGAFTFLTGGTGLAIIAAIAAIAAAGYLLYRNWDRIAKAARPLTRAIGAIWQAFGKLAAILRGALMTGLRAIGQGFMQAVAPGKSFHGTVQGLAGGLTRLAQVVLPSLNRAFKGLAMWMEEHQRAFRIVGRIIGTVVVAAFRLLGGAAMGAFKVIRLGVNIIRGMIRVMTIVTKATQAFGRNVGTSIRRMTIGVIKNIRSMGSTVIRLWQTSIWGRAAKFLVDRARGMVRTLSNFRQDASRWVKSLVPGVVNPWKSRVWEPAARFLVDKRKGWGNTLSNFLAESKRWVANLASAIGPKWRSFWQGTADFVGKIKNGILDTMSNLVQGVIGFWDKLISFINSVLSKVGLDPIGSGQSSSTSKSPTPSGAGGRARGGLDSGRYGDSSRQPLTDYMARGGLADGKKPRVVYGEAGPEAYVTLGRYTKESAEALNRANEIWSRKGWMDRARSQRGRAHRRDEEGLGPTHYNLVPEVKSKVQAIAQATGTSWNSYVGHGQLGGSTSDYTADFWGPGGRGSPISKSAGYKTASLALEKYNSNPGILYMIRQGEYWRDGSWSGNTFGDPHYDHTHISWDSPGGASAGGGMSIWDAVGNAAWNALVQPRVDDMVKSLSTGFILKQAAGKAIGDSATKIKEWIIGKTDVGGGSSASGGDAGANRALGEELLKSSGVGGSFSSLDSLWTKESGWDRYAKNASSGAYGIPQALPESKLPAAGQQSGGSNAGPQISWGLDYIRGRYGSTDAAWGHSQSAGWYAKGGIIPGPSGRGVMIQAHAGERVLPPEMVRSFDKLAQTVQSWSRSMGGTGISVGPRGVQMPGLSVSARGIQINPRQLHRGAYAQEDAARTLRRVERRLGDLDKRIGREVREGVNRNVERGLDTNRALDKSDARRLARQLAGGPRISRAL